MVLLIDFINVVKFVYSGICASLEGTGVGEVDDGGDVKRGSLDKFKMVFFGGLIRFLSIFSSLK